MTWTGPTQDRVDKQIEMIEQLIPGKPDLIAVAANDPIAIVPVLKKAQAVGIHVMSWDGDTRFREFFVNLVDFDDFGAGMVEALQEETGSAGDIAIVTTSFTAPNQVSWIKAIKKHLYAKYPDLKLVDIRPAGECTEEAFRFADVGEEEVLNRPFWETPWWRHSPALQKQSKALKESWEKVEEGEMPPWYYRLPHPEARLSTADRSLLRAWAGTAGNVERDD